LSLASAPWPVRLNGIRVGCSYLVQWTGYGVQYTDWVPVTDGNIEAIASFNPAVGVTVGEHTDEMVAHAAALDEFYKVSVGGKVFVHETRSTPFYNQLRSHGVKCAQQTALYGRRRIKRRKPATDTLSSTSAGPASSQLGSQHYRLALNGKPMIYPSLELSVYL
jgi:hypothetical protein